MQSMHSSISKNIYIYIINLNNNGTFPFNKHQILLFIQLEITFIWIKPLWNKLNTLIQYYGERVDLKI